MKRKSATRKDDEVNLWEDSNTLAFTPLGSGREVGRSCHVLEFQGKKIMLDCGIHPGRQGMNMLPYLDRFDMSEIDLLLLSHFHLDHAAALPYLTERTTFKGQIYTTNSTKAVLRLVLTDYARILSNDPDNAAIYSQEELVKCLEKCQTVGFHQTIEVEGIKITPYYAGHVLGAAMFLLEVAGVKILYTGDYSREDDRHLRGAEIPAITPDVLIVEATFGLMVHEPREQREKRFTESVEKIVRRGGNCLIPMGALGGVQELLLILEDHWNRHPDLKGIPIFHTSRIANEALKIYRSFMSALNDQIRSQLKDPWTFENIGSLGENEEIVGPAVVLASPGYLQSGKSRKLFEQWCSDRRNGVILAGYSVEGTLAKDLSRETLREVTSMNGVVLPVECEVKTITFAAHADFIGTKSFVDQLKPKNIIFVHGESEQMSRLKNELQRNAAQLNLETDFFNPENGSTIHLQFQEQRIVKAYGGELVQKRMRTPGSRVAGYLVRKDFADRFIATEDIRLYTQLKTAVVTQKLHLPFSLAFTGLESAVKKMFRTTVVGTSKLKVHDKVDLDLDLTRNVVCMTWETSPSNDMIADALVAILMQVDGGIPAVRIGTCCSAHAHTHSHVHHHQPHVADTGDATIIQEEEKESKDRQVTFEEQQQQKDTDLSKVDLGELRTTSQAADLVLRLLEEMHGKQCMELQGNKAKLRLRDDLTVVLAFDSSGHVVEYETQGDDPDGLATQVKHLVSLACQTVHPII